MFMLDGYCQDEFETVTEKCDRNSGQHHLYALCGGDVMACCMFSCYLSSSVVTVYVGDEYFHDDWWVD